MSRYVVHIRFLLAVLTLILAMFLPSDALAGASCDNGLPISFGTLRTVQWAAQPLCTILDMSDVGTLAVEASTAVQPNRAAPVIEVLTCGAELRVLDRWAASWLTEVIGAGRVAVCVTAEDPSLPIGEIKLTTAFTRLLFEKAGDPDEDEVDPDPTRPPPPPPLSVYKPNSPPLMNSTAPIAVPAWCAAVREDDHADLFRCATPLRSGETVEAEIRNAWGDDSDFFVLHLDRHASLRLAVDGEDGITVSLHDRHGDRLWTPTDAQGFVKALAPGLYFVRVSASAGFEGAYGLDATVLPR